MEQTKKQVLFSESNCSYSYFFPRMLYSSCTEEQSLWNLLDCMCWKDPETSRVQSTVHL